MYVYVQCTLSASMHLSKSNNLRLAADFACSFLYNNSLSAYSLSVFIVFVYSTKEGTWHPVLSVFSTRETRGVDRQNTGENKEVAWLPPPPPSRAH